MKKRIFVHGFPALYGGAGTELHHQILAWQQLGIDINIIPTGRAFRREPLYPTMIEMGVTIHPPNHFSAIQKEDPIIGFCNSEFLDALPAIRQFTKRTIFVNCMTWLFEKEKDCMERGEIAMFLYQNDMVRKEHERKLRLLNPEVDSKFMTFKPYFDESFFPFIDERDPDFFGCGRISRQDTDKYAANTLHIYEYFVAPKFKKGLFLGFDERSQQKIGKPYDWIRVARDHNEVSQQEFYRHCEIILQPTDTTENWPRIGFEAMASGSVLIVDNRGGWKEMIEHGKTGWLCDHERDFIYYASKMAYEPSQRKDIAAAARERAQQLGGLKASMASWTEVYNAIEQLDC